jgi:acetyltransferase
MGIEHLECIFHPRSLAVVGANEQVGTIGDAVMRNLIKAAYDGDLFPIHPDLKRIHDIRTYANLNAVPVRLDMVVAATPIGEAPEIVRTCGELGVGGVVVIAGGAGIKDSDAALENEAAIGRDARRSGVRIIGPNCLGIFCAASRLNANFANCTPLPGKVAFISQSGGITTALLDLFIREHIGLSYFVSLGAMLDVNFGDMIDYLGSDPQVSSIVMHMEKLTRFREFMSAARAVSRVKPIIALKAGRTRAGAVAAMAHSGATASDDAVYDAAFKRAGIIRVKTFEELFDCAELAAKQPRVTGPGLAILTNSGGAGVMATDALCDYGAQPVSFAPDTLERLSAVLPSKYSHLNPLDILGNASEALFIETVRICREAPEVNALLILLAPSAVNEPTAIADALVPVLRENPFPVFTVWLGGASIEAGREIFNRAGIPTFDSPERAVRAYMNLYQHCRNIEALQEIPPHLPGKPQYDRGEAERIIRENIARGRCKLTEIDTKSLLGTYGIPVRPGDGRSPQGMPATPDFELTAGARMDPDFGPVIYFGLGGIQAGIPGSRAMGLPPLNRLLARRIMEDSCAFGLLHHMSDDPAPVLVQVEGLLIHISQLVTDFPQISKLDLQVRVHKGDLWVRDARVILAPSAIQAPFHLVISAYPVAQEVRVDIEGVGHLLVRPIRPEDASLMVDLFGTLSRQSIYNRFFAPLNQLPPAMLARLTQIDYDREIALVAIMDDSAGEKILGVSRIIQEGNWQCAEFAALVGDPWHGLGIGATLLQRCLWIAKQRGISRVWGIVLAGNRQMLALGRKLGFCIERSDEPGEFTLSIDLTALSAGDLSHR